MTQSIKTAFFFVLFIFLGLFLYTTFAGPIPFFVNSVQTTKSNLFTVQGTGKATGIPTTVKLSFGVTKSAPNAQSAQNQVNQVVAAMIEGLKGLGIAEKDIMTTNYSVSPQYDFTSGKQTINGYMATQNLEIQTKDVDKAQKAADIATQNGANLVGGVTFILDDQTRKELEQKARTQAVQNAKEKAEGLAKTAGITLGRVIDVSEQSNQPPIFADRAVNALKVEEQQPTQLTPGESTIEITVSLSYETR